MIETLGEDYVRTARAKGICGPVVTYRHGLRAAMTPVVTIFGLDLASQLTGAIFTEPIFGLPASASWRCAAFDQYDLPVLMGGVLVGVGRPGLDEPRGRHRLHRPRPRVRLA